MTLFSHRRHGEEAEPSSQEPRLEPVYLPAPVANLDRWSWSLAGMGAVVGGLSALAAALVRLGFRGLEWLLTGSAADLPAAAASLPLWRRALTPALGALLAMAVLQLQRVWNRTRETQPKKAVEYVEAVRHQGGRLALSPNLWRTGSAAFSVASGAAVGREGSMIQFAAAIASRLSTAAWWGRWRLPDAHTAVPLAVACGVAGGVTAAYNAPIAAAFFAAEIVLGGLALRELFLLAVAAGSGWLVSGTLLGRARLYPTALPSPWHGGWMRPLLLLMLALLCGALGPGYQWCLGCGKAARRVPLALLWGALVVAGLSCLDPRAWGNADVALRTVLTAQITPKRIPSTLSLLQLLALRLCANLACVWTGTVGGAFTPTLFVGAALGALFGLALPQGGAVWAVAGMSLFIAAVTHAPLMAACMAVELTGTWEWLPILILLNVVSSQLATRLSPEALYAIASQVPESGTAGTAQP